MAVPQGLVTSLNQLREISSDIYHKYVPVITETTDIGTFGAPILTVPEVQNEFIGRLLQRIVYTSFEIKYFKNPLQQLEGDRIPLGYAGQEIYVNPAKARKFNVDDFAGLLFKYESDVKVQYMTVNSDLQYCVTVSRAKLKQAFVSWESLDSFIDQLSNSLYNGAYIDEYKFTKELIAGAYKGNNAQIRVLNGDPTTSEAIAKEFVKQARTLYLNFQTPSSDYNAWSKMGGAGRPIITWSNPEDIVFVIRNDVRASLDVDVLASAFNMDRTDLLGRIITVDNFDMYSDEGEKIFDGSAIVGMLADKSWFRIKRQDMFMDEFYNANNRTWQFYLNLTKSYNYSLFANGLILATEKPNIPVQALSFETQSVTIENGTTEGVEVKVTPVNATGKIEFSIEDKSVATVVPSVNIPNSALVTGLKEGQTTLTAKNGNVQTTVNIVIGHSK